MDDGSGQVTFMFQVGLVRDFVTTDASQLTLKTLKDLACNFINQRVSLEKWRVSVPFSRSPSSLPLLCLVINQLFFEQTRNQARTKALIISLGIRQEPTAGICERSFRHKSPYPALKYLNCRTFIDYAESDYR